MRNHPNVRSHGKEWPAIPIEAETLHWAHWDPFSRVEPFSNGKDQPSYFPLAPQPPHELEDPQPGGARP